MPNMFLFFLKLQCLPSYWKIWDFSLNRSCKTYRGPMLPPYGRNWQLISPHYKNKKTHAMGTRATTSTTTTTTTTAMTTASEICLIFSIE